MNRLCWAVLTLLLSGCAMRVARAPVPLLQRNQGQFLTAVAQMLQAGDITQQPAVEAMIGTPLVFARAQSTLFGQAQFFRAAPGSAAAPLGVLWETITLESPPPRPTRVASLEIGNLPRLVCVDEAAVTHRFSGLAMDDSTRAVTVYSGPGQEGEFYVRFVRGTDERCFAAVTFAQDSNRS